MTAKTAAATAAPGTTAEVPPVEAPPVDDEARRRRRRRWILLALLAALVAVLLAIVLWYLIFRRPLPLPIPPGPENEVPAFSYALYDVTKPLSVAVGSDGTRVYVTQGDGTQETVMFDSRGTRLGVLKPPSTVTAHATQLYLAIDPLSGEVYASDRMAGQIYVYAADGTFAGRFNPGNAFDGWQPLALAFDSQGHLYVADAGGTLQVVHEFDRYGALVRNFGIATGLSFPNGLAVDGDGNLYVSDTNDGRLIVFDASGTQVGVVGRGPAAGELGLPVGIAIDDAGRVFVVDSVSHAVQVYRTLAAGDRSPRYLASFGVEGTANGAFEYPNGIALDARGHVYVADWNNDRVQVWSY